MLGAVIGCALTVVLCVYVHLTTLRLLNDRVLPRFQRHSRTAVGMMVLVALVAHLLEIWIFAITILVVGSLSDTQFAEELQLDGFDAFYYSAVSYTSMGAEPLDIDVEHGRQRLQVEPTAPIGRVFGSFEQVEQAAVEQAHLTFGDDHREPAFANLGDLARR